MKRLLTFLSALSLLLCIATCVLWITSYFVKVAGYQGPRFMFLRIDEGDNYLFLRRGAIEEAIFSSTDHKWYSEDVYLLWVLAIVMLLSSGICFALRRMPPLFDHSAGLAPVRPGVCPACGYDLRATPDRCPECGMDVTGAEA